MTEQGEQKGIGLAGRQIPEGALESPEETLTSVRERRGTSGKTATIIEKRSTEQKIKVEPGGLEPDEWWFENVGISPEAVQVNWSEMQHIWRLVEIFTQMEKEGQIQGFDFGIPYFLSKYVPEGTPPKELENVVAIFLTSPYRERERVQAKVWELKKRVGLLRE